MIAFLSGHLREKTARSLIVDVGGVGYEVFCPTDMLSQAQIGDKLSVFTYLNVRENALELYGFLTDEEKRIFQYLIDIPGIGPKSALNIISVVTSQGLVEAISVKRDVSFLYGRGIGKKTADKVFAALQEKLGMDILLPAGDGRYADVVDALMSLGYDRASVMRVVSHLPSSINTPEEKIKHALQMLR